MPGAARKGAIQFGMVYIPVSMYTTVSEGKTTFNQLHRDSHVRIKYKKVREDNGQEVPSDEIVKGYQYEPGKYVIIDDDELEKMKTAKDKAISIIQFVLRESINPVFYDKTYYLTPDGSDKAYALLHAAMMQENVMAIARTVLGTSETMLTISPMSNGSLLMETMYFIDEVKPVPQSVGKAEIKDTELQMARMIVQAMIGTYQPEQYHDTYAQRLHEAIMKKIQGQEIVSPQGDNISPIDLMEALKRSIEQVPGLKMPLENQSKPMATKRNYTRKMPNFSSTQPPQNQ